jgi:outer membrane murein-binding lipoprotein Lpp
MDARRKSALGALATMTIVGPACESHKAYQLAIGVRELLAEVEKLEAKIKEAAK